MLRSPLPLPPPRAAALLATTIALVLGALELLASWLVGAPSAALHVGLAVAAFELGTTLALGVARRLVQPAVTPSVASWRPPPAVSVLVAAWNEASSIERTVRGLLAQEGVTLEVIVADDGSTDGTSDRVPRDARVRVVRIAHAGKGAALEAARAIARHPIVVTVDADTELAPAALVRIAAAFDDPRTVAAGGAVAIRGARDVFTRFQFVEYVKTTWHRVGWAALGMLEQLPGAFSAFRADVLDRAGGFPLDSLTEDYEVTYRIRRALRGEQILVALVSSARAWTEPPRTLVAFTRQRTRWFAGFLSTLFRFRGLILDRRLGAFGVVRLPIKVLDAVLPLALLSTVVLFVHAALSGAPLVSVLGAVLLGARVLVEVLVFRDADALHVASAGREVAREPSRPGTWLAAVLDAVSYAWLRSVVVLRAYPFALLRIRTWERSREVTRSSNVAVDVPAE